MDVFTKKRRSFVMSRIRSKHTRPELALRKLLRSQGHANYRLHKKLPGYPDVVFSKVKIAIFIDGCFWHGCSKCCARGVKSNKRYWTPKILANKQRDALNRRQLRALGWKVIRVWEHELEKHPERCLNKISRLLLAGDTGPPWH